MSQTIDKPWVKVWDPLVRYGHWALVAMFALAYFSADDESGGPRPLHVWSGYAVGVIVAVRIVWGVIGTPHARFADFAYSPVSALAYLRDLVRGQARRYLGHSPIGAAMVVALLVCLSGTVWTGLAADGETGKGPLAHSAGLVMSPAHAEDEGRAEARERRGEESVVGKLHGALANITVGLVLLHILGVSLASAMHRENLVLAMFNGKKRPGDAA